MCKARNSFKTIKTTFLEPSFYGGETEAQKSKRFTQSYKGGMYKDQD